MTWPPPDATETRNPPPHRRHRWETTFVESVKTTSCRDCGKPKDEIRSRRGFNARKRGNALQARVAKDAGISNIGALGLPEDAGGSRDWLRLQVKSGGAYPRLMDRWLRAITVDADQLRGVVIVETPGPGFKAKRLIVMDYDEFLMWFGPNRRAP